MSFLSGVILGRLPHSRALYVFPGGMSRLAWVPVPKSMADDIRFKSKSVTDRDQGKEPLGIVSEKPLPCSQRWANETLNVAPCPSLLLLASFSAPVLINPLHCFLQGKVIGGTFSWEKLIQLSLMGQKVAHLIFGVLTPQDILRNPLPTFLGLK